MTRTVFATALLALPLVLGLPSAAASSGTALAAPVAEAQAAIGAPGEAGLQQIGHRGHRYGRGARHFGQRSFGRHRFGRGFGRFGHLGFDVRKGVTFGGRPKGRGHRRHGRDPSVFFGITLF
ncbi:MAG: hypothetical protein AAGC57_16085 [Pseudomonadota bacterium]